MTEAKFTPPPITGYRPLSAQELALINEVKAKGLELQALVARVNDHLGAQASRAHGGLDGEMQDMVEVARIRTAEPARWLAIGRTHLQEGLMALTRAIAQPGGF
jgi:hypothetical protein